MTIMFGKSPLKRQQREMMAVVVSKANDCLYCQKHHGAALEHYWKDQEKVERFRKDYHSVELEEPELRLCELAEEMTADPANSYRKERVEELKTCGFSDRAILDAMQVIAYFNFVNRLVMGLGVELEEDEGKGYEY